MDTIVGFINDLTGEKRGPAKNYRRFNLITLNNNVVNGWIFATMNIEETSSGKILMEAASKNEAVAVSGKITKDEGGNETIRVSINNKFEKRVDWAPGEIKKPDYNVLSISIHDALKSIEPVRLDAKIIDVTDEIHFVQNEKERIYKIYIIADSSGAAPIIIYDDLINGINVDENYTFTQIKTKKLHENNVFYSNSNSIISKSNTVIEPNLVNIEEIMSTNFIDVEEITTNFDEIMENKVEAICVTCKNKLVSIVGKEHLVKCNNCSKYLLTKPDEFNINVVIQIGDQKQTFYTSKNLLQEFFKKQHENEDMSPENICEFFLTNGPWKLTLSHIRRQILQIKK